MSDNLMLLAAIWLACMGIGLLCIALFSRRDDFETDLPDRIGRLPPGSGGKPEATAVDDRNGPETGGKEGA